MKTTDTYAVICDHLRNERDRLKAVNAELVAASIRMIVGITKQSRPDCDWYEGIEFDGADEARAALAKARQS